MKLGLALSLLISVLIMVLFSTLCFADPEVYLAAIERGKTDVKVAWIYGGAIAIAGVAIGIGLYFGLRSRSSK